MARPKPTPQPHLPQLILHHPHLQLWAVEGRQRGVQYGGGWDPLQQLLDVAVLRLLLQPPACCSATAAYLFRWLHSQVLWALPAPIVSVLHLQLTQHICA
jgi:hypothetical protein